MNKKEVRLRRARKTRAKIAELKAVRLTVFRSNSHIYAQVISGCGFAGAGGGLHVEPAVAAR
jgi:large subunit ribosomal protein L18